MKYFEIGLSLLYAQVIWTDAVNSKQHVARLWSSFDEKFVKSFFYKINVLYDRNGEEYDSTFRISIELFLIITTQQQNNWKIHNIHRKLLFDLLLMNIAWQIKEFIEQM